MLSRNKLSPEYAPVKKILLALPYEGSDWQPVLNDVLACYREMVQTFLRCDKSVAVVVLVKTQELAEQWAQCLELSEEQRSRLNLITSIDYNDTWIRDYGPLTFGGGADASYCSFTFNGWGGKYEAMLDNAVAEALEEKLGAPVKKYQTVLEGGALEINGKGVLLLNRDCIIDEHRGTQMAISAMEDSLKHLLGAKSVAWLQNISLTGDDTDGHIDTIARFVSDNTIVACGESPDHPDAASLARLNEQLQQLCKAHNWRLVTVPVPRVHSKVDQRLLPATYANFLICNGTIYLPIYGVPEDQQAIELLEKTLKNYTVIAINCAPLLEQHGSLHCATMQVG